MAIPGESDPAAGWDLDATVRRLGPGEVAKIPVELTTSEMQGVHAEFLVTNHGWPFLALNQVKVNVPDVDLADKPETVTRPTLLSGSLVHRQLTLSSLIDSMGGDPSAPIWLSASSWRISGDWFYISWAGLLTNLGLALGTISLIALLVELRLRFYGTRIRLWEFLACVFLIAVAMAIAGDQVNKNKRIKELMESDRRYKFYGSSAVAPQWISRLCGNSLNGIFQTYPNCQVTWDINMPKDFWKPAVETPGLEELRIFNSHYDSESVPLSKGFFRGISRNETVQSLILEHSEINTDDLSLLTSMPNLESLMLKHTPIDDRAVKILSEMKTLKELSLTGSELSVKAIGELRQLRPDLDITF